MKKELKDYLHLYLGCNAIMSTDHWFNPEGNKLVKVIGAREDAGDSFFTVFYTYNEDVKTNGNDEIKYFKPILRPLSSMKDDEAIELVKLREWKQYGDHPTKRIYETYRNSFGQIVVSWGHHPREKNLPETKDVFSPDEFTYLLSKGFDLFNLIREGLAIDSTTIK